MSYCLDFSLCKSTLPPFSIFAQLLDAQIFGFISPWQQLPPLLTVWCGVHDQCPLSTQHMVIHNEKHLPKCALLFTLQEPSQLGYCVDTGLAVMLQCHLVIKTSLLNYKGATCTWDYKKSILAFHVDDPASIVHTFCSCGHIQESIFPDTEINIQHVYISFKYLSDSLTEC